MHWLNKAVVLGALNAAICASGVVCLSVYIFQLSGLSYAEFETFSDYAFDV